MHVFAHIGQITVPPIQNVPSTPICARGQVWNAAAGRCESTSQGSGVAVVLVGLIVVGAIVASSS